MRAEAIERGENLKAGLPAVILGVSLSNLAFNRRYCAHVLAWLRTQPPARLEVIVFDVIEAINYRVFRGLEAGPAAALATERGHQLERMFQSFDRPELRVTAQLESQTGLRESTLFSEAWQELRRAYALQGPFMRDVHGQVLHNLEGRRRRHGEPFVLAHLDELAEYVLQELAYFYVLFRQRPGLREIYPGPNLWVKEKLCAGQYAAEVRLEGMPVRLNFQTVTLHEEPVRRVG